MKLKKIPIFLLFLAVPFFAHSAEENDLGKSKLSDTTEVVQSINLEDDYNTFLSIKFKKSKGYKIADQKKVKKYALLEKHISYASFNLGFASYDIDNKMFEPFVKINETFVRNAHLKVSGGYFVDDNVAVGLGFNYSYYDAKVDVSADIPELLVSAKDYSTSNAGRSYSGIFVVKNFVPLNKSQRIFITNTTGLSYEHSVFVGRNVYNDEEKITKTTSTTQRVALGISPGIMYFMTRGFAFEFAFNPISVYYQHSDIINNETQEGYSENYGLTFQFIPFNIQLGFSYYFGLDYVKHSKITDVY